MVWIRKYACAVLLMKWQFINSERARKRALYPLSFSVGKRFNLYSVRSKWVSVDYINKFTFKKLWFFIKKISIIIYISRKILIYLKYSLFLTKCFFIFSNLLNLKIVINYVFNIIHCKVRCVQKLQKLCILWIQKSFFHHTHRNTYRYSIYISYKNQKTVHL